MSGLPGVPVLRLHHLGVLVEDLEAAMRFYGEVLGLGGGAPHEAPEHDIRAILVDVGESQIELFAPLTADGPIARTLAKRGAGMHHVAFEVDDGGAELARLASDGAELIDETPRRGMFGLEVAFVHPNSVHGVLSEVVSLV